MTPIKQCSTPGCRKPATKHRTLCHCCRQRSYRAADPIRYQFNRLKAAASKRSVVFRLDKDWFRELCEATGYHEKAGLMPGDLSLDRIDPLGGYTHDNVRVVTRTENTAKGNIERIPNIHIRRALLNRMNAPAPEPVEAGVSSFLDDENVNPF